MENHVAFSLFTLPYVFFGIDRFSLTLIEVCKECISHAHHTTPHHTVPYHTTESFDYIWIKHKILFFGHSLFQEIFGTIRLFIDSVFIIDKITQKQSNADDLTQTDRRKSDTQV